MRTFKSCLVLVIAVMLVIPTPVLAYFGGGSMGIYRDAPDLISGYNNPAWKDPREGDPDFAASRWGLWPAWASRDIAEAVAGGILRGGHAGTLDAEFQRPGNLHESYLRGRLPLYRFRAESPISRAEFLAALRRVLLDPEAAETAVQDCPAVAGQWYAGELGGMIARGIASPGEQAAPSGCDAYWEGNATRREVGVWLGRAASLENLAAGGKARFRWRKDGKDASTPLEVLADEHISPRDVAFPDMPPAAAGSEEIALAARVGLIQGYPEGLYQPEKTLTRAEAAVLLVRLAKRLDPPAGQHDLAEQEAGDIYRRVSALTYPDRKLGLPDDGLSFDPGAAYEQGLVDEQVSAYVYRLGVRGGILSKGDPASPWYDKVKDYPLWTRLADLKVKRAFLGRGWAAFWVATQYGGSGQSNGGYMIRWTGGTDQLVYFRLDGGRWIMSGIVDFYFEEVQKAMHWPKPWFTKGAAPPVQVFDREGIKAENLQVLEELAPPEYFEVLRRLGVSR